MAASTKTTEQASEESPGLHGMYRELWGLEKGGSWSGGGVGVGACSKCQSHRAGGYRGCRTPHSGHQIKKEGKGSLGSVHLGSIQNLLTQKKLEKESATLLLIHLLLPLHSQGSWGTNCQPHFSVAHCQLQQPKREQVPPPLSFLLGHVSPEKTTSIGPSHSLHLANRLVS